MRPTRFLTVLAAALLCTALVVPSALAQYGPPGGVSEEETEVGKNLSTPAIFVPNTGSFAVTCDGSAEAPVRTGTAPPELTALYPDYYLQGYDTWQGACVTSEPGTVLATAAWGDNLISAPLKVRTPIRVEIGLLATGVGPMDGYEVVKLDPTMLDREAPYGTLGVLQPLSEVRVWDADATFQINGPVTLPEQPMTAEINSTGRVVFGYNWRTTVAGTYVITFHAPNVDIGTLDNHDVSITIDVGKSSGGGGGGGPRH